MPDTNLRLLPPHTMRLAQLYTELGAYACSHMSGGYDLINALFYKLYDDVLSVVVPDPSQLDESAAKLYNQLKNFGSEDTSEAAAVLDKVYAEEPKKFESTTLTIFEYCNGEKVHKVVFTTELVEPINKVTYPWWKVRGTENQVMAYVDDPNIVFADWPDVKQIAASDLLDSITFSSDYPAPTWWLEHTFLNKRNDNAPIVPA